MSLTTAINLNKNSKYQLNNGTEIPVAAYGVYLVKAGEAKDLVYAALEAGYRHIDSAAIYKNEKESAEGIAAFLKDHPEVKREDIWFTTKIWNDDQGFEETKRAVESLADKVKEYIQYVDLVLLHSPLTSSEKRVGSWKALQEYVLNPNNSTLRIRSIGVSNFGQKHIQELLDHDDFLIKPVVNQLELHPWLPRLELREYCLQQNILLEAYSPLTQGYKLDDPELLSLAKKYNINKAQLLLKWSYLQGFIVIAKTEKKERIKENLDALPDHVDGEFSKVDLDEDLVEALNKPESHEVLTWGNKDPTQFEG